MKFNLIIVFFFAFHVNAHAQSALDLKPIEIKSNIFNTKYFYDDHIFESPYGLQIPLMESQDSHVNSDFNVFRKSRKTANIINLISSVFSFYGVLYRDEIKGNTYWTALGIVGLISASFSIRSGIYLNRSIKRYNKIASGSELGFHYDSTFLGNGILSVGMVHTF